MTLDMFCDKQYIRCRDHRKLGQELDLFSIESESAGGGLVFWHPNGAAIRNILENFWKVSLGCTGIPFVPSVSALYQCPLCTAMCHGSPTTCALAPPLLTRPLFSMLLCACPHHVALHPLCHHSAVKLRASNLSASLVARWTQCKEAQQLAVNRHILTAAFTCCYHGYQITWQP